jgi:hypothetical protein
MFLLQQNRESQSRRICEGGGKNPSSSVFFLNEKKKEESEPKVWLLCLGASYSRTFDYLLTFIYLDTTFCFPLPRSGLNINGRCL